MICQNCARLMNNCALLRNKIARLEKVYAAKPDQKTAAIAVLERNKLKNENKKLSEKVRNISSKCMEIKKILKQREAYIKALSKRLEKNALKKEVDNYILMYNDLNEKYKHQIEEYEYMEAVWSNYEQVEERWQRYCNQLRTENENIKKQLEDREAENNRLSRMLQKYSELESLSDTNDIKSLIKRTEDKEKNVFLTENTQLNNIINHNDIQDINNNNDELRDASNSRRSDIYRDDYYL